MPATPYWEYIRVEELLSLPSGSAATEADLSNDKAMFILVHQIDELWFDLVLRQLPALEHPELCGFAAAD